MIQILIAILMFASPACAFNVASLGGSPPAAAPSNDSCTDHLIFSWHAEDADLTTGTPAGCTALGDATATYNQGALSTTYATDGTKSFLRSDGYDYAEFTSNASFNEAEGTVEIDIRVTTFVATGLICRFYVDASNYVVMTMERNNTDMQFKLLYRGNATNQAASTPISSSMVPDTWYRVTAKWRTASSPYLSVSAVELDASYQPTGTAHSATGTTALTSVVGDVNQIRWGDAGVSGHGFYIDRMKIWDNWQ